MRKRYSEKQIAQALRLSEQGVAVSQICRQLGISDATFYAWKKKYAGMGVSELRRVKQLEDENRRLKQMVAEQALDIQALKAVVSKKF